MKRKQFLTEEIEKLETYVGSLKEELSTLSYPKVKRGQVWKEKNRSYHYLVTKDTEIGSASRLLLILLPHKQSENYTSQWFFGQGRTAEELEEILHSGDYELVEDYQWGHH